MKLRLLVRVSYGDFDMRIERPMFVSSDLAALESKAAELNAKRTEADLAAEIKYDIAHEIVHML